MDYEITYYDESVAQGIADLPMPLGVRYVAFVKKTQKTPKKELNIAKQRLTEVKQNENS